MGRVPGINAVFHDPAAVQVINGVVVAAAEEERLSRREHGESTVPFATWELPEQAIGFCFRQAGITGADLDAALGGLGNPGQGCGASLERRSA